MAVSESEHFFGTALAIEEINNAGAILGREIELFAYAGRPFEIRLCGCSPRTASLGAFGGFCFARAWERSAMDASGSTTSDEARVKVACIQMRPTIGKVEANVAHGIGLINRAAELGAKLIVLPELSNTGYMFQSREEAFALSEPIPDGRTVGAWSAIASRHNLHL